VQSAANGSKEPLVTKLRVSLLGWYSNQLWGAIDPKQLLNVASNQSEEAPNALEYSYDFDRPEPADHPDLTRNFGRW
jgi:hypothetical protein